MKNIWNVCRKDLKRVFQDKRMIFSTIILPGLIIFCMYTVMGLAMSFDSGEIEPLIVYVNNETQEFNEILNLEGNNFDVVDEYTLTIDEIKDEIYNGNIDLFIDFTVNTSNNKEVVTVYYNNAESDSTEAYNIASALLVYYNSYLQEKNNIDPNLIEINAPVIISEEEKVSAQLIASIMPMLIVIFIFASALGNASESIAGEKERNTLATLLVTPVNKTQVILGKTLSCLCVTFLASLSSFLGIVLSIPILMSGAMGSTNEQISFALNYDIFEWFGIFTMIILVAVYGVTMILSASVYAKNIKEASSLAMPIYLVGIFLPIIAGMVDVSELSLAFYFIPFYNTILSLKGLMSLDLTLIQFIITVVSSGVYISILVYALTKLFNKERILFSK